MLKLIDNSQVRNGEDGVLLVFEAANNREAERAYGLFDRTSKLLGAGVFGTVLKKERFNGREVNFALCPHYDGGNKFWLSMPNYLIENAAARERVRKGGERSPAAGHDDWISLQRGIQAEDPQTGTWRKLPPPEPETFAAVVKEKDRLERELKQLALGFLVEERMLEPMDAIRVGHNPRDPVHRQLIKPVTQMRR